MIFKSLLYRKSIKNWSHSYLINLQKWIHSTGIVSQFVDTFWFLFRTVKKFTKLFTIQNFYLSAKKRPKKREIFDYFFPKSEVLSSVLSRVIIHLSFFRLICVLSVKRCRRVNWLFCCSRLVNNFVSKNLTCFTTIKKL